MAWSMHKISPLDTLFFRDGRPFVAGEGTDVVGRFPPTPLTLQGLIRSKLLSLPSVGCTEGWQAYRKGCGICPRHQNCQAEDVVGSVQPKDGNGGSLRIRGPWILANDCPLLPIPMDLIANGEHLKRIHLSGQGSLETEFLSPADKPHCSSLPGALKPLEPQGSLRGKKFMAVPGLMVWARFQDYLCGLAPKLTLKTDWWRLSDLWGDEFRPGLQIEDERSRAEQGMLYFARHARLRKGVSLGIEMDGLGKLESHLPLQWVSPLGGERRAVAIERMASQAPWQVSDPGGREESKRTGHLKLVLVQMGWFKEGWRRSAWDVGNRASGRPAVVVWDGQSASWVAARVERPEIIGGWNLAEGDQRPVRRFVPAGAVYHLKGEPQSVQALGAWLDLHNQSISETPNGEPFEYSNFGLGQVFVGTW